MGILFILNSILLGVGLAMDAFSVSIVNGLNNPNMKATEKIKISSVYAWFQFMMPMIGWFMVHTMVQKFQSFEKWIPWIALILLAYIGGKMLLEGLGIFGDDKDENVIPHTLSLSLLLIQGIATSIDALSVGFTISNYSITNAVYACLIIATVTFIICRIGLQVGIKVGTKINDKASILGGIVLIGIGLEIFIRGVIL